MFLRRYVLIALLMPLPALAQVLAPDLPDAAPRAGQRKDDSSSTPNLRETPPPAQVEGMWPSKKLRDLLLVRWADEIGHKYELDDSQRTRLSDAVTQRWGTFLDENRSTIQPLANEFVEMRMELTPPSKERVQEWAKRATPMFERFREQLQKGTSEFRQILTPKQRPKFELEVLQFSAGLHFAEQKLKRWHDGEFDKTDFWQPTAAERRKRRAERRRRRLEREEAKETAATAPLEQETDQIALELQAWERYVEEFIRTYMLNEGQRTTALSVLSELKQRALTHRDTRLSDIEALERRIATFNGSEDGLAELKLQLTELYGPIDEMFKELKRRIEPIPTAKQRAATQVAKDE